MNKPVNWDNTKIDAFQALTAGGHKCVIMEVEETTSKSGYQMLIIYLDTDKDDKQPKFYQNRLLSDQQAGRIEENLQQPGVWKKYWKCKTYLVYDERTDYGTQNLMRFTTAVSDSNPGFTFDWGPQFTSYFKNKKVGVVFREEEYTKMDNTFGVAVKPMRFCNYSTAEEQPVPKIKLKPENQSLADQYQQFQQNPQPQQMSFTDPQMKNAANEGFMQIAPDALEDEGLPFR